MQVWIAPSTGVATAFLEQLEKISSDSTALMLAIFAVFALVHSGLAYLRPYGKQRSQCSSFLFLDMSPPDAPLQMPQPKDCHVCQCYLDVVSMKSFLWAQECSLLHRRGADRCQGIQGNLCSNQLASGHRSSSALHQSQI